MLLILLLWINLLRFESDIGNGDVHGNEHDPEFEFELKREIKKQTNFCNPFVL